MPDGRILLGASLSGRQAPDRARIPCNPQLSPQRSGGALQGSLKACGPHPATLSPNFLPFNNHDLTNKHSSMCQGELQAFKSVSCKIMLATTATMKMASLANVIWVLGLESKTI